jgi:hypothetical protein
LIVLLVLRRLFERVIVIVTRAAIALNRDAVQHLIQRVNVNDDKNPVSSPSLTPSRGWHVIEKVDDDLKWPNVRQLCQLDLQIGDVAQSLRALVAKLINKRL